MVKFKVLFYQLMRYILFGGKQGQTWSAYPAILFLYFCKALSQSKIEGLSLIGRFCQPNYSRPPYMDNDLNFPKMEEDLNLIKNGR
jgi:hypothetical protein